VIRPLDAAAAVLLASALVLGLVVPPDAVQGDLQRIMYVHVPSAWLAYLSFFLTLVGSVAYLRTRRIRWDHFAGASAEVGVVFTALALVTGSIWGKPVWGVWWTWDARLVLTAVMFFVYLGYLALRRAIEDPPRRAGRAAAYGIVAVLQIPLVHFSVVWWRGLHQPPTVLRPGDPQIDGPLLAALLAAVFAFTVAYAALVARRREVARLEDELLAAGTNGAVAGGGVTSPTLAEGTP
jgi:heme exporter protein C